MRRLILGCLAVSALSATPAAASVVFSDNFNSYSPASAVPWGGNGVWTTGNSVDLVKSGEFNLTCVGGSGNCVDLSGDRAGSISKVFTFAAGTYSLSFAYTGNQLDAFGGPFPQTGINFSVGSLSGSVGPLANNSSVFTTYTGTFTSTGAPVTLTFAQQTGGNQFRGSILDNVSISSVPEPAAWALMIAGFGLVGGATRARRRKAVMVYS